MERGEILGMLCRIRPVDIGGVARSDMWAELKACELINRNGGNPLQVEFALSQRRGIVETAEIRLADLQLPESMTIGELLEELAEFQLPEEVGLRSVLQHCLEGPLLVCTSPMPQRGREVAWQFTDDLLGIVGADDLCLLFERIMIRIP